MKKIIILLLCCGVLVSMVGCGGNTALLPTESPPTIASETVITETPTETTPPTTAVEPTEKEKELPTTESADQATEPTVTATEPTTTTKPTKETKPTEIIKATDPSAAENTEPKVEEPPKEEEIYVGIQWPEVNPVDIERLVVEKVNAYRKAQGDTAATMLPGLTEVARYRANELTTNFSHTSPRDACGVLKYGEFVDMTLYGLTAEDSYYQGFNREAIGMGDWFGTAESMSDRIAD